MNYYKRHIGDYARKAGHLSPLEHGVYNLILDAYYDREQAPTRAAAIRYARARTADEIAAVDAVLSEFFTLTDGVYVQTRVEEEFLIAAEQAEKNRRNGKAGGRPRKAIRIPVATQPKPSGLPDESETKGNPLIHESINPEQEQKLRAGASSAKRGTRSPPRPDDVTQQTWDDWLSLRKAKHAPVTETVLKSARSESGKAGLELEKFLTIWCARGSQGLEASWLKPSERNTNGSRPPSAAASFLGKTYTGTAYEDLPASLRPENAD